MNILLVILCVLNAIVTLLCRLERQGDLNDTVRQYFSIQLVQFFLRHPQRHIKWKEREMEIIWPAVVSRSRTESIFGEMEGKLTPLLSDVTHADDQLLQIFTLPTEIKQSSRTAGIWSHVHVFSVPYVTCMQREAQQVSSFLVSSIRPWIWIMSITLLVYLIYKSNLFHCPQL